MLNVMKVIFTNIDYFTLKSIKPKNCILIEFITIIYSNRPRYILSGNSNNEIQVLKYAIKAKLKHYSSLKAHMDTVLVIITLTYSTIASGSKDSTIKIWAYTRNKLILSIDAHKGPVSCLLKLNEKYFLSSGNDSCIKIWSLNYYTCLKIIDIVPNCNILLASSGEHLLCASGRFIQYYHVYNNVIKFVIKHTAHKGNIVALAGNNTQSYSAGEEKSLSIFTKDKKLLRFKTPNIVFSIQVDENKIITTGNDKIIRIYGHDGKMLFVNNTNHLSYIMTSITENENYLFGGLDGCISSINILTMKSNILYRSHSGVYCIINSIE
jgi:WD40 repeat protein